MKTGIIGILNNPSTSANSHSAGWNEIIRHKLDATILTEKDDWDEYDRLVINHGPNFKPGSFNVMGGINKKIHERIYKLTCFLGEIYQVDGFQLRDFILTRSLDHEFTAHIPNLELPKAGKLLVGDSHAISVWTPEYDIDRRDGKTLWGFLKDPIKADFYYFGNIDIRFHLGRQPDPVKATKELAKRYIDLAIKNNAAVSCLLPVESETRKLPRTGLYKKQSFFGPRELRQELVYWFNYELIMSEILDGLNVHRWPSKWYVDTEFYEKEVMEPRGSVHIRPKYYASKL